jgi:hypothetical protein
MYNSVTFTSAIENAERDARGRRRMKRGAARRSADLVYLIGPGFALILRSKSGAGIERRRLESHLSPHTNSGCRSPERRGGPDGPRVLVLGSCSPGSGF